MAQSHASIIKDTPYDLFILAGELSGDAQAAKLLEALLKAHPHLKIAAVAGPKMRAYPIHVIEDLESLNVMGFKDVVVHLPKIYSLFRKIKGWLIENKPKLILLIDYAEFNLFLAQSLKKALIPSKVIQYVCPSIWAWRHSRKKTMVKSLDYLICLFPFELNLFSTTSLKTGFFGHPLANELSISPLPQKTSSQQKPILTLFPGSRKHEIRNNLPIQLSTAFHTASHTHQIAISCAHERLLPTIQAISSACGHQHVKIFSSSENSHWMKQSDIAIATSGTINLELAFHRVPTLVTYFISKVDLFIASKIFKIYLDHYCIVNIHAKKMVFPEFFGPNLTENNLQQALIELLQDASKRDAIAYDCEKVFHDLCQPDGTKTCTEMLISMIKS